MNKKFLSAILFGALMVTSTGTFVSCKDYDDDIENLQGQITANTTAIAELKALIGDGNYVTSVTLNGKNLVVATKNGSTTLALPECEDEVGSLVEVKEGVLYIDGEATEFKVAAATEFQPAVKIVEGEWAVLQEDNTYLSTGIPASGVTAVQNADKSWTLTVTDAEGNTQEVKVPSAASLLTDLNVIGNAYDATPTQADETVISIAKYNFTLTDYSAGKTLPARDKWAGPRGTIPADGVIYSQMNSIYAQINPTVVDAAEIDFVLVDSKNNNPSNVNLVAYAHTALQTRAANANGMYRFVMEDVYFKANNANGIAGFLNQFQADTDGNNTLDAEKEYALTAGGTVRSAYTIAYLEGQIKALNNICVKDACAWKAVSYANSNYANPNTTSTVADVTIDLNKWYYMEAENAYAMWDMDLSVAADYVTLYGIELQETAGSWAFRATKTPDNVTRAAFPLSVKTISKSGSYNEAKLVVGISSKISEGVAYDAISHELSENNDNDKSKDANFFSIDLANFKSSMNADDLATWNIKANKIVGTILNANKQTVATADENTGIEPIMVTELKGTWSGNVGKKTASPKSAANIVFLIDNNKAATTLGHDAAGKQFYMNIKFYEGSNFLNELTVPFSFTLPAITELFEIAPGYLNAEGVANLYMYEEDFKSVVANGAATFKMSRIFSKFSTNGFKIKLDGSDKIGSTEKTSAKLAYLNKTTDYVTGVANAEIVGEKLDANLAYLTLYQGGNGLGGEAGYAQTLKLNIYGQFDAAWTYPSDATFKFEAKVLSPIEQGQVVPKDGNVVTLTAASKDANLGGYKLNNTHITGITYNAAEKYNVLPDVVDTTDPTKPTWTRKDIFTVEATPGDNNQYFTVSAVEEAAEETVDGKKVVEDGYFLLKGNNLTSTVESTLKVKVTDIWKRSVTSTVPVKITVE